MKKLLLWLPVLLLAVISCSKQPQCNNDEVQKLVVETLKKKISNEVETMIKENPEIKNSKNYSFFLPLIKNRDQYIDELEPQLFKIRSTEVNQDIQKCNCEADLNVIEKNNNLLKEIKNEWVGGEFSITNFTPTLKYSAQITNEKEIYINIENSDELEILKRNIYAKVLHDIIQKNNSLPSSSSINTPQESSEWINNTNTGNNYSIQPGNYYTVYGSPESPVFFYKTPNSYDRKNARFTTVEEVYVESVSNDFGFVRFTNSNNQTSKGWIRFIDLN